MPRHSFPTRRSSDLAPKNYYITDRVEETVKQKGVTIDKNRNNHLNEDAFADCLFYGKISGAENNVLRAKGQHMTKQILIDNSTN
jgi:hypothetical protein